MAAVAMGEVLENEDLVKVIVRNAVANPAGATPMEVRSHAIERLRTSLGLAGVNWLFLRVNHGYLRRMMRTFRSDIAAFRDLANALVDKTLPGTLIEQLIQVHARCTWPSAAYGLDLMSHAFTFDGAGPARTYELETVLDSRMPAHAGELLHMLERRCVCCNAWIIKQPNRPGAWGLHPYAGTLLEAQESDGTPYVFLQGVWIPHTCEDHFVEVAFGHDAAGQQFSMRMYGNQALQPSREELRFNHFLRAARRQPWFAPNIARLFIARDPRLCSIDSRHGGGMHDRQFVASICMYAPRMEQTDWSLQSIFGLTRAGVAAMVRRGSAMAREERLLSG